MLNPKVLLLPFMVVFEIALMLICLCLAFAAPKAAIVMNNWSQKLPDFNWYIKPGN